MELVCRRIRERIMAGELVPGSPLREEHIARELGVSATPVREAFRRLANEGWITSAPYRGSFIRRYSSEELDDLFRLREALEGLAVRLASSCAPPEQLDRLRAAVDAEAAYIAAAEKRGEALVSPSFEQELAFHTAVAELGGSPLLTERLETLKAQLAYIFLLGRGRREAPAELKKVNLQHRMIWQAVSLGWGDIAEQLIRRHISEGRSRLREDFHP